MNEKTFDLIAGILFGIVALVHLVRLVQGWPITVEAHVVPMWVSWLGVIIPGILAYFGLQFGFGTNKPTANR